MGNWRGDPELRGGVKQLQELGYLTIVTNT